MSGLYFCYNYKLKDIDFTDKKSIEDNIFNFKGFNTGLYLYYFIMKNIKQKNKYKSFYIDYNTTLKYLSLDLYMNKIYIYYTKTNMFFKYKKQNMLYLKNILY